MITIGEYTDLFLTIILGLGVIFELPILVFFLALMGVVSAGWMWRNLRYSILGIFTIAAIVTPTTDIMKHVSVRGADDHSVRDQHCDCLVRASETA
jgi:sec-independent protein translocase protein TatC